MEGILEIQPISMDHQLAVIFTKPLHKPRFFIPNITTVHTWCWAHKLNLVGNVWALKLTDLNNCVVQTKHLFLNTLTRKHVYIQFLTEKYNNETKKPKYFPIPVSIVVNYFKALNPSEVQQIHCQAVMLSGQCSKRCNLLLCLESNQTPQAYTFGSKLSDPCKSLFYLKMAPSLRKLQPNFLSFQSRVSLEKLHQLIDLDAGKDFISSLGQLFDPSNVVQSDLGHNDVCKLMNKLPLLRELPSSQMVNHILHSGKGFVAYVKMAKTMM
ncbi:hypothetical protein PR048_008754 [Dryococelus australis]|uniref:Uncharacterized protein n=1 Tax=Dryococelus australis TaxID=614101 RepID=A0ABQ9HXZ7_9NEOP|nr:hypothetical protein PR048_008754 [Dryococelus australis]